MGEEVLLDWSLRVKAKHDIIKNYMDRWLPIMTSSNKRVLYFDGFCGPGEYKNGKAGSPIIALKTALNRQHDREQILNSDITWLFVDDKPHKIEHLEKLLSEFEIPDNYEVICKAEKFTETVEDFLEQQKRAAAPAFIFIDPFGFSHHPMDQIKDLMGFEKCEVLINFMFEFVNRFAEKEPEKIDSLYGTKKWRQIEGERSHHFLDLYRNQLKTEADIEFVREFKFQRENKPSYYLFFGTNDIKGLEKMTEVMWKIDPMSGSSISDKTYSHQSIMKEMQGPNWNQVKEAYIENFSGEVKEIEDLLNWSLIELGIPKNGIKSNVLKPLEENKTIKIVDAKRGRNKGTYPEGTEIEFFESKRTLF